MRVENLIPWHRSPNGSTHAAKRRLAVELVMVAVAIAVFRGRRNLQIIGGGTCGLLALGELRVIYAPTRHRPLPIQPKGYESMFGKCYGWPHPLDKSSYDRQTRSLLADEVGIVPPHPTTLETYQAWFNDPTLWGLQVGHYYFYESKPNIYTLHLLVPDGPTGIKTNIFNFTPKEDGILSDGITYKTFSDWTNKLESQFNIENLQPINYCLIIDIQNTILRIFRSPKENTENFAEQGYTIETTDRYPENLSSQNLLETIKLKVKHHGGALAFSTDVMLSPYRAYLRSKEEPVLIWELENGNDNGETWTSILKVNDSIIEFIGDQNKSRWEHQPKPGELKFYRDTMSRRVANEQQTVTSVLKIWEPRELPSK